MPHYISFKFKTSLLSLYAKLRYMSSHFISHKTFTHWLEETLCLLPILCCLQCCFQGYRTLTALVARPWCLVEILSKEEIINIVTDASTETGKLGKPSNTLSHNWLLSSLSCLNYESKSHILDSAMEARYNCCKSIHEAFSCSNFVDDPLRRKTSEKVPSFSSALFN